MSELRDDLICDAVCEFHERESLAGLPSPGAGAAWATVQRRRKNRVTTFSVLGALLVAVPLAAFAANPRGNNPPPGPADSGPPIVMADPITGEELAAAHAVTPPFADAKCATTVGLKEMPFPGPAVYASQVVESNLDDDPERETAALVLCLGAEVVYGSQVVGYERDLAGNIVSLGAVVAQPEAPQGIILVQPRPEGGVIATVGYDMVNARLGLPEEQLREYAWENGAFRQVDGATAFEPAQPADLKVSIVGDVVWRRTTTVTVKIENLGPGIAPRLELLLSAQGLQKVYDHGNGATVVTRGKLGPGETFQLDITMDVELAQNPSELTVELYSWVDDPNPADNTIRVTGSA